MRVEGKEIDRLNQALSKKFRSEDKWVAYDCYNGTVTSQNIATFRHVSTASAHCESHTGDRGDNDFYYFRFKPIINVIKALTGADSPQKSQAGVYKLDEQIRQYSVKDTPHNYKQPLVETLTDGLYHPVHLKQEILPWTDIESYRVIEHYYPKGMIYEMGHGYKSHRDFASYYEAQKCFDQLMDKHTNGFESPELKLIGKIKGQELALNLEDFPETGTGVLFKIANSIHGERRIKIGYESKQLNELNKPVEILQQKMARFNWRTTVLEFFDGMLQKVAPGAKIDFMNFSSLCAKPIEITNSLKQTVSGDQQQTQGAEKYNQKIRFKPGL